MFRFLGFSVVLLSLLSACGKNDGFYSLGNGAWPYGQVARPVPPQAPLPTGYGSSTSYYPPPMSYPQGAPMPPPVFSPQLPPAMPVQFIPFIPVYQYVMVYQPQIWVPLWTQWQQYAQIQHINMYDFGAFWYGYCPSMCGQAFQPAYPYLNNTFYSWMAPGMNFSTVIDPVYFWGNYSGYPF